MPDLLADPDRWHVATGIALPAAVGDALEASAYGPFTVHVVDDPAQWLTHSTAHPHAALILVDDGGSDVRGLLADAAPDTAVLIVVAALDPAVALEWWQRGAQDVLLRDELAAPSLPLRLRAAIERKRLERDARTAYATDLDTGLPHQQQLIEHMSQLIALREREPAPMALLALRIEGAATTEARLGSEAAHTLRRKVGVRLRAGVRASDVVASIGADQFAVLLGTMLTPADAQRVGAKLLKSLLDPFKVAGEDIAVAAAIGIGEYPRDGSQPEALLRRALGLASAAQAQGRAGFSNLDAPGGARPSAANDD